MLTMTARGSFDWDALSGWADLGEYFEAVDLGEWKRDVAALGNFLGSEGIITDGEAFGALPNEDRAPFQQMTFTLHDTQAEQVREALKAARSMGDFTDSPNENSNGNALARICEVFLTEHGDC
jgi:hypothetical protein